MAAVVNIGENKVTLRDAAQRAIDEADRVLTLRDAVTRVIRAIHGLPEVMGTDDLGKLVVYIGRARATARCLNKRWRSRYEHESFNEAPSTHALVAVRAPMARVRNGRWESAAQRVVNALKSNRVLCVANAITGENGKWPECEDDDVVIYVVARVRPGLGVGEVDAKRLNDAVLSLADDAVLTADVRLTAAAEIIRQEAEPHFAFASSEDEDDESEDDESEDDESEDDESEDDESEDDESEDAEGRSICRSADCNYQAYPGNYGFCRRHR